MNYFTKEMFLLGIGDQNQGVYSPGSFPQFYRVDLYVVDKLGNIWGAGPNCGVAFNNQSWFDKTRKSEVFEPIQNCHIMDDSMDWLNILPGEFFIPYGEISEGIFLKVKYQLQNPGDIFYSSINILTGEMVDFDPCLWHEVKKVCLRSGCLNCSKEQHLQCEAKETKNSIKNRAFLAQFDIGCTFSIAMTAVGDWYVQDEKLVWMPISFLANELHYALVIIEGNCMPLSLFLQATKNLSGDEAFRKLIGVADNSTLIPRVTTEDFVNDMNEYFGNRFAGIAFTPYIDTDERKATLETARKMCEPNYHRLPAPFTVPNRL